MVDLPRRHAGGFMMTKCDHEDLLTTWSRGDECGVLSSDVGKSVLFLLTGASREVLAAT